MRFALKVFLVLITQLATTSAWMLDARANASKRVFAITTLFVLLVTTTFSTMAQNAKAGEQISSEAKRLEQRVPSLKLPEAEANTYLGGLARVEVTSRSGRVFLSLYYLQPLHLAVMTYDYHRSKAEVIQKGKDAFEAEWHSLGEQLAAKEKTYPSDSSHTPAAAMALAEASLTLARPYYQSGHLYGLNQTINEGAFYLGRSNAFLDFALFCRQVHFEKPSASLRLRALDPELAAMEAETLAAYERSEEKDLRPFINTNVSLKVATDLNREQRYFGALLKYLDACLTLKLLKSTPPDAEQLTALKKQQENFGRQLSSGKTDHSIGLIYWEMAQRALKPSAEDEIGPDDLKRAAVIINEVLPRYFKVVSQ